MKHEIDRARDDTALRSRALGAADVEAQREELLRRMRQAISPEVETGIAIALAAMPVEKISTLEFETSGTRYANAK